MVALGGVGGVVFPIPTPTAPPSPQFCFSSLPRGADRRMGSSLKSCDCGFCRVALIFNGDSHPSPDHTKTLYVISGGFILSAKCDSFTSGNHQVVQGKATSPFSPTTSKRAKQLNFWPDPRPAQWIHTAGCWLLQAGRTLGLPLGRGGCLIVGAWASWPCRHLGDRGPNSAPLAGGGRGPSLRKAYISMIAEEAATAPRP